MPWANRSIIWICLTKDELTDQQTGLTSDLMQCTMKLYLGMLAQSLLNGMIYCHDIISRSVPLDTRKNDQIYYCVYRLLNHSVRVCERGCEKLYLLCSSQWQVHIKKNYLCRRCLTGVERKHQADLQDVRKRRLSLQLGIMSTAVKIIGVNSWLSSCCISHSMNNLWISEILFLIPNRCVRAYHQCCFLCIWCYCSMLMCFIFTWNLLYLQSVEVLTS